MAVPEFHPRGEEFTRLNDFKEKVGKINSLWIHCVMIAGSTSYDKKNYNKLISPEAEFIFTTWFKLWKFVVCISLRTWVSPLMLSYGYLTKGDSHWSKYDWHWKIPFFKFVFCFVFLGDFLSLYTPGNTQYNVI